MRTLMLLVAAAALATAGASRADDDGFGVASGPAQAKAFKLGKLSLVALHDAQFVLKNDTKVFGVEAGAPAVADVLRAAGQPDDRITLSVNALLVKTGKQVVLLDTGLGAESSGALLASLKAAGIPPQSVTDIVITHSHFDHVGGLADKDGKLIYPHAKVRMAAAEWTFMKGRADAAALVKALDGHVVPLVAGKPIAPGVTPVALDGHTPGHMGYEIVSGGQRLLDIGDMAHSFVISLARPAWVMGYDSDSGVARATREATLARLAKDQDFVFAPHFPFPGVGHIATSGDGFRWVPDVP